MLVSQKMKLQLQTYLSGHEEVLDILSYVSSVLHGLLNLMGGNDAATPMNKAKLWRAAQQKRLKKLSLTLHPDKAASGT